MTKDELITKWNEKHSEMLEYYKNAKSLSSLESCYLRSEMKNVLEFIEDLKNLKYKTTPGGN